MALPEKVRIDKWMWAVRLFKTRSIAAEACEKNRIKMGDLPVKASRNLKPGDEIIIHRGVWQQTVKVLQLAENRMSGTLAKDFVADITPDDELEKLKQHQASMAAWNLKSGAGRPTKKDRRAIDDYMDDW